MNTKDNNNNNNNDHDNNNTNTNHNRTEKRVPNEEKKQKQIKIIIIITTIITIIIITKTLTMTTIEGKKVHNGYKITRGTETWIVPPNYSPLKGNSCSPAIDYLCRYLSTASPPPSLPPSSYSLLPAFASSIHHCPSPLPSSSSCNDDVDDDNCDNVDNDNSNNDNDNSNNDK